MSLLRWQELTKRKTDLVDKIKFVDDTILKNHLGEKTSQEKVFKPITTKLDDVALSNLKLPKLQRKRGKKKMVVPDYGIPTYDEHIPNY